MQSHSGRVRQPGLPWLAGGWDYEDLMEQSRQIDNALSAAATAPQSKAEDAGNLDVILAENDAATPLASEVSNLMDGFGQGGVFGAQTAKPQRKRKVPATPIAETVDPMPHKVPEPATAPAASGPSSRNYPVCRDG